MTFATIWDELAAGRGDGPGQLRRRIHPDAAVDLHLVIEKPSDRRMLSLSVRGDTVGERDEPVSGRAIESRTASDASDGRVHLQLVLLEPRSVDIFEWLVADIARSVAAASDDDDAVALWDARLRRWQRLLNTLGPDGLSGERQRGLYGELLAIRDHLLGWLGEDAAIGGWTGPLAASHDFELPHAALEVKSTARKQHQVLRITSERQLDDTGTDALLLLHVSLDARRGEGETLPDAVEDVRKRLAGTTSALMFEERLLDAGYADAHAARYRSTAYTVREQNFFEVREGFPRIIETDLPSGVGDVRYSVAVSECRHFAVNEESARTTIFGGET